MTTLRWRTAIAASFLASALLAGTASAESPALSPGAEALRVELALQYDPASVERRFYHMRGYLPVWLTGDGAASPAARALLSWAGEADANGLPVARYDVSGLKARLAEASPGAYSHASALETELTRLFLTYARDLSSGLLEPHSVNRNIEIAPRRPDPGVLLAGIGATGDVPAFLGRLAPAGPGYDRLLKLYAELREIERSGSWGPRIAGGRSLRPGDRDPRIAQLRARLIALGDLAPAEKIATSEVMNDATPPTTDPSEFDPALAAAVRRFQARHGLNADGVVGPMTLGALNTTASERAAQAAVNLERLRWHNYDLGARHILINIAAFTMTVIENGATRFSTRTVVGAPGKRQTPEFNDALEYIAVNPNWNVPRSIASTEILAELQQDPAYLELNNMELVDTDLAADEIDWSLVTPDTFPGRIVQRPGPDNELGAVKFMFPNDHAIYMHDTPWRDLFADDWRAYSHGCIRLQDPIGFAHLLLSLQYDDPAGVFARLQAPGIERWATMAEPIPVYLTYRTAWLDADGVRQFRADLYRRDRDVMAALAAVGVSVSSE